MPRSSMASSTWLEKAGQSTLLRRQRGCARTTVAVAWQLILTVVTIGK